MLDLERVKLVLLDFDDTLCVHKFHNSDADTDHAYYVDVLLKGTKAWDSCSINKHMKKFMTLVEEMGIDQGLISTTDLYTNAVAKVNWVKKKYGVELENYCVGSFDAKLDMVLALQDANGYEPDEILIVDDFWQNLERLANEGFQTCTPLEIVNFIEENGGV